MTSQNPFPAPIDIRGFQRISSTCSEVDEVFAFNGNFMKTVSVFNVPTIGFPLDLTFTYNAQDALTYNGSTPNLSPLGNKWRHTYMIQLIHVVLSVYAVMTDTGRYFQFQDTGEPDPSVSSYYSGVLSLVGSNRQIQYPDGSIFLFDTTSSSPTFGFLLQKTDPHGNVTTLTYNSSAQLTAVTEPTGRQLLFVYDPVTGLLTSVEDPNGNIAYMNYDANQNLHQVTTMGALSSYSCDQGTTGCAVTYDYTLLTGSTTYVLTGRTDGNGNTYTYGYDMTSSSPNYGWLTSVTDAQTPSNTISYAYTSPKPKEVVGTPTEQTPFSETVLTDARGHVWSYRFDNFGNLWRSVDPLGHQRHYYWDQNQKLMYETGGYPLTTSSLFGPVDNLNNVFRRYAYDYSNSTGSSVGNLQYGVDGSGLVTAYTYDPVGTLYTNGSTQHLLSKYPGQAHLGVQGNWAGQYGTEGYVLCAFNGGSDVSSLPSYLSSAVLTTGTTSAIAPSSSSLYPTLADPRALISPDSLSRAIGYWESASSGSSMLVTLTASAAQTFNLSVYTNSMDQGYTGATLPAGQEPYAPFTYHQQWGRDLVFTVKVMSGGTTLSTQSFEITNNASGVWVTFPITVTASGQTVTVEVAPTGSNTDGIASISALAFDANDDHRTLYSYDSTYGNMLTVTRILTDPNVPNTATTLTTTYTYNINGTVATVEDANDHTTSLFYEDAHLNLTRIVDAAGNTTLLTYDLNGNMVQCTDAKGHVWNYAYDSKNRLLSNTDPLGHTTCRNYDEVGNLLTLTDANGHATTITYTDDNRVYVITDALSNTTTFSYDEAGNLTDVEDARSNHTSFAYDACMRLQEVSWPQNDVPGNRQYAFDAIDRLRAVTSPNGTQSTLSNVILTAGGNLLQNPNATLLDPYSSGTQSLPTNWTATPSSTTNVRVTSPTNNTPASMQLGLTSTMGSQYWSQANVSAPPGINAVLQFTATPDGNVTTEVQGSVVTQQFNGNSTETLGAAMTLTSGSVWSTYAAAFQIPGDGQYDRFPVSAVRAYGNVTGNSTSDAWFDTVSLTSVSTAVSYDNEGRTSQTQTPDGNQSTLVRDRFGRVVQWTDGRGNTCQATYDSLSRITSITDALGLVQGVAVTGHTTFFAYDNVGNLTAVTDPNGNETQYVYDVLNRLTQIQYPDTSTELFGYDPVGNLVSYTNNRSQVRTYTYDAANRLVQVTYQTLDPLLLAYDAVGNLVSRTDSNGDVSKFTFDAINRLIGVERDRPGISSSPPLWLQSHSYDAVGNRVEFDNGVPTAPVYDTAEFGTPPSTEYAVSPAQWTVPATYVPIGGNTTAPGYNAANQVKAYDDALSNQTQFTYDVESRCTGIDFPNSVTTTASYDIMGRLVTLDTMNGNTTVLDLAYAYDQNSNRVGVAVNQGGNLDGYDYVLDPANRLVNEDINRFVQRTPAQFATGTPSLVDTSGTSGLALLGFADALTAPAIDADRWRLAYANPTLNAIGFEIRPNNAGLPSGFQYDGLQMVFPRGFTERVAGENSTDSVDIVPPFTPFGLNANTLWGGTEHRETLSGAFTAQVDFADFQALKAGSSGVSIGIMVADAPMESAMTSPQNVAILQLDGTPQYSMKMWVGGSPQTVPSSVATTDTAGGLQIQRDGSGNLTFWRLVSGVWTQFGSSATAFSTATVYVSLFLMTGSYSAGAGVFSNFALTSGSSALVLPTSGTYTSPVYDAGQSVTWDSIAWTATTPAGTVLSFEVYAASTPTGPFTSAGPFTSSGSTISGLSGRYAYYVATFTGNGSSGNTPTLSRVDLLYGGTNTSSTYTYGYDGAGNVLSKTTEVAGATTIVETRTVNDLNQVTANAVVGNTTTDWSFSYDLSGNMDQRENVTLSQTTTYTWNELNQLTEVQLPGGATVSYTYDVLGRMLTRTDSSGTTQFVWDGMDCIQETDPAGVITRYYNPTGMLTAFDRTVSGTTTTYQTHVDAIGSIRTVTDSSGAVVATYDYDAWGNQLASTSDSIPNGGLQYRFVGAYGVRWDAATGLYYIGRRWYDSQLERFLSQDLVYNNNRYGYVFNNPTLMIDIDGLEPRLSPNGTPLGQLENGAARWAGPTLIHEGNNRNNYMNSVKNCTSRTEREAAKSGSRRTQTPMGRMGNKLFDANKGRKAKQASIESGESSGNPSKSDPLADNLGKLSKLAGLLLTGAQAAMSLANIYNASPADRGAVTAREAGSWTGAFVGGTTATGLVEGAITGAETGLIGGPLGVAVGLLTGLAGGGLGGYLGGQAFQAGYTGNYDPYSDPTNFMNK